MDAQMEGERRLAIPGKGIAPVEGGEGGAGTQGYAVGPGLGGEGVGGRAGFEESENEIEAVLVDRSDGIFR